MRASLASATSILALLVFESLRADAATVTVTPSPYTFGDVLVTPTKQFSLSNTFTATASGTGNVTFSALTGNFGPTTAHTSASGGSTHTATTSYTFTPTTTGTATTTATVSFGGATTTLNLTGLGVAPVASVTNAISAGYVLVGQTAPVNVVVTNTGNGNLAAAGAGSGSSLASLTGSIGAAGNSVFTGDGGTFSLQGTGTVTSASTDTFAYTFKPTTTGTTTTTVTSNFNDGTNTSNAAGSLRTTLTGTAVAPVEALSGITPSAIARVGSSQTFAATIRNVGNGNLAGTGTLYNLNGSDTATFGSGFTTSATGPVSFSLIDNATSTVGYTYAPTARGTSANSIVSFNFTNGNSNGSNLSQSVVATVTGTAVGPVYTSSLSGASGTNTPAAVANGSVGSASSTISFGTLGRSTSSLTVDLYLKNITPDLPGSVSTLTDLTIKSIALGGADPSYFTISSFTPGDVIDAGAELELPITVVRGDASGLLTSTLTVFTDESTSYGGVGDTFTYLLSANVPEPATLAILGAGLAGLASVRRRKRA